MTLIWKKKWIIIKFYILIQTFEKNSLILDSKKFNENSNLK